MPSDLLVGALLAVFSAALCILNCYLEDHVAQAVQEGGGTDRAGGIELGSSVIGSRGAGTDSEDTEGSDPSRPLIGSIELGRPGADLAV